jgi:hypothetical protein
MWIIEKKRSKKRSDMLRYLYMEKRITEQEMTLSGVKLPNVLPNAPPAQAPQIYQPAVPVQEPVSSEDALAAAAARAARIAEAEGQVARFNAMYEQYALNPLITKQRMFYETLEDLLPGLKVIITDGNTQAMLPVESFVTPADGSTEGEVTQP